jgi:D-alanine-D-alanine ligase
VVKPVSEGSSVGVQIIRERDNKPNYSAWNNDVRLLVEEYIPGRELTTAVMGDKALGVTELTPHDGFYDYEAKYTDGKTTHVCPADIPDEIKNKCMDYALRAHQALGCRGVSRADFRWDEDTNRVVMLEVNTQPGMMGLSLVPEQAAAANISFPALVSWMVEVATCDC